MEKTARKIGRPLSFDRDTALRAAMLVFWRHGYESTSLSDLTTAMGITPPSLYAAFGDKKRLFLAAVDLYANAPGNAHDIIQNAATARDAARGLLTSAAIAYTGQTTPSGCLIATGAISCSEQAADVQQALADIRQGITDALQARIVADIATGHLPQAVNARPLAVYVMAVIQGLSTLARDGGGREAVQGVAELAMKAWPR